jgi:ATP-dependent Lhr-like helicase
VENIQTGPGGVPGSQVVIHTYWGGRVNRPFALALDAAWEEQFGHSLEIFPGDDSIALQLPDPSQAAELFRLVTPENLEDYLRRRLESSGFFGARFRENAGRALLLTKRRLNERMPLWMSRLRSQKLLQSVMPLTDFPVLLETWRTCLQDEFDLEALRAVLREIAAGNIRVSECTTSFPSPMAQGLTWAQINQYMYAADGLPSERKSRLRSDLLREVVFSPGLRPTVPEDIVRGFEARRQRTHPGYAPLSARDLVDWVKERVLFPWAEWEALAGAIRRDQEADGRTPEEDPLEEPGAKLVRLEIEDTGTSVVTALERLPHIRRGLYGFRSSTWALLTPSEDPPAIPEGVSASMPGICSSQGTSCSRGVLGVPISRGQGDQRPSRHRFGGSMTCSRLRLGCTRATGRVPTLARRWSIIPVWNRVVAGRRAWPRES